MEIMSLSYEMNKRLNTHTQHTHNSLFLLFQTYVAGSDVSRYSCTGCQPLSNSDNTRVQQPSPSAVISVTPSSLDAHQVCQQGSTAFVQFSSCKVHIALPYGENHLPESPRGDGDVDDPCDGNDAEDADKAGPHACDVCAKAFSTLSSLNRHKGIHTGRRPFVCDVCNKAFTQAGHLGIHKRIHTGHKPFVCDVCSRAFTGSSSLKRHERIHTGGKPFVCDLCSKAFTRAGDLRTHKRIHTGHKPFVCEVCDKAFTTSGGLSRHKRIHTGHRPFICNVCNKALTTANGLSRHQRVHIAS